jgi:hypothetical protein
MPRHYRCQTCFFGVLARVVNQISIISAIINSSGTPSGPIRALPTSGLLCGDSMPRIRECMRIATIGTTSGQVGIKSLWAIWEKG